MRVNVEEINKVIEALKADGGSHLLMGNWFCHLNEEGEPEVDGERSYEPCHTAFCIAGWTNFLRFTEQEAINMEPSHFDRIMSNTDEAARRLGLVDEDGFPTEGANRLFYLDNFGLSEFDNMPPNVRSAAAIRVLEILRDTGEVNWGEALRDAGAQHYMKI